MQTVSANWLFGQEYKLGFPHELDKRPDKSELHLCCKIYSLNEKLLVLKIRQRASLFGEHVHRQTLLLWAWLHSLKRLIKNKKTGFSL